MKRLGMLIAVCVVAGTLSVGCSKGSSDRPAPEGPITDSAANGLKQTPTAAGAAADPVHGKQIFAQNCASCHGANAQGGVGPSLQGERKRKNDQQTIAWIENPQPPMPKLYPSTLSESDVADVAAYVQAL